MLLSVLGFCIGNGESTVNRHVVRRAICMALLCHGVHFYCLMQKSATKGPNRHSVDTGTRVCARRTS